jgi:hypothetical protein
VGVHPQSWYLVAARQAARWLGGLHPVWMTGA